MDVFPFIITLSSCLFLGLEYGMIVGVGFNLIFILNQSARPIVTIHLESVAGYDVVVVKSHDDLKYASAEFIKDKIDNFFQKNPTKVVLLDGVEIFSIDSTVAMVKFSNLFVGFQNFLFVLEFGHAEEGLTI